MNEIYELLKLLLLLIIFAVWIYIINYIHPYSAVFCMGLWKYTGHAVSRYK